MKPIKPPRFANWLLRSFCSYDFLNTALWDLYEIYEANRKLKGKFRADTLYFKEVLGVIYYLYSKGKSQHSINQTAMFKNNMLIGFRSLKKDKSYSILNIIGLSSALVALILTCSYVFYEFSYDRHHDRSEDIYRIYKSVNTINQPDYRDAGTPGPLAKAIVDEFPEVLSATRFIRYKNILMETESEKFVEPLVIPADADVFRVFSFKPLSGDINEFLDEPYTIAISRSVAQKYFNRLDVVGETVTFQGQLPMKVSGVFEDMPDNSHFKMHVLVHFESVMEVFQQNITRWGNNPFFTYIKLESGTDFRALETKLPLLREKYAGDPLDEDGQAYTYFLQSLSDVHFNKQIEGGIAKPIDAQRLYIYLIIAIVIMVIACVNYINLATARSLVRMKEIGVRKVIGAKKSNLIFQFLTESGILVFSSMIIAVFLSNLFLPTFINFVGQPLSMNFNAPALWGSLLGLGLLVTLISGIYPSILSTSFKPINAIYGRASAGRKGGVFRNSLVVFQFVMSTVLIIGAIILNRQLNYVDSLNTGYSRDNILVLKTIDDKIEEGLDVYMEQLSKVPGVAAVATSWSLPTNITSNTEADWKGITDPERLPMYQLGVTYNFFELYDIKLAEGRFFEEERTGDKRAIILNETAVKRLGWKNPIGRNMTVNRREGQVIGVVKDFHMKSLRDEIEPLQIILNKNYATLSVKVNGPLYETIASMEKVYQSFDPDYPFQYQFFNDIYDKAYEEETKTAELTLWLTGLTIIIACLGLYGLVAHRVQHRKKELGVRKVMGASALKLVGLLSKDFLKLQLISFVIAVPSGYFLMSNWLNEFAYHVSIGPFVFLGSLMLILLVSAITVGHRTYKAAVSNPINALRDE